MRQFPSVVSQFHITSIPERTSMCRSKDGHWIYVPLNNLKATVYHNGNEKPGNKHDRRRDVQ